MGPGKTAFFVTEEFALEQGFGKSAAVHCHKWIILTRTGPVNSPGNHFLTGTGFTDD